MNALKRFVLWTAYDELIDNPAYSSDKQSDAIQRGKV